MAYPTEFTRSMIDALLTGLPKRDEVESIDRDTVEKWVGNVQEMCISVFKKSKEQIVAEKKGVKEQELALEAIGKSELKEINESDVVDFGIAVLFGNIKKMDSMVEKIDSFIINHIFLMLGRFVHPTRNVNYNRIYGNTSFLLIPSEDCFFEQHFTPVLNWFLRNGVTNSCLNQYRSHFNGHQETRSFADTQVDIEDCVYDKFSNGNYFIRHRRMMTLATLSTERELLSREIISFCARSQVYVIAEQVITQFQGDFISKHSNISKEGINFLKSFEGVCFPLGIEQEFLPSAFSQCAGIQGLSRPLHNVVIGYLAKDNNQELLPLSQEFQAFNKKHLTQKLQLLTAPAGPIGVSHQERKENADLASAFGAAAAAVTDQREQLGVDPLVGMEVVSFVSVNAPSLAARAGAGGQEPGEPEHPGVAPVAVVNAR